MLWNQLPLQLEAAGLPEAFLAAVAAGVLATADAVCCVPSTLTALCLNPVGLQRVRASVGGRCGAPSAPRPRRSIAWAVAAQRRAASTVTWLICSI